MRIGTTLPQFRDDAEAVVAAARAAEEAGLDGVFVFDHLWPLGSPHRPILQSTTLLAALAVETSRICVGTLVTRVGVLPDAVLVHGLLTVHRIAGDRLVVGLGTGDSLSKGENLAYGVEFGSVAARRDSVIRCCRLLRAAGARTWIGGRSPTMRRTAVEAPADGWNAWGADPPTLAAEAADLAGSGVEPTWAGPVLIGGTRAEADAKLARHGTRPDLVWGTVDDVARHLDALEAAGATWAVCTPLDVGDPSAVETLAQVVAARR